MLRTERQTLGIDLNDAEIRIVLVDLAGEIPAIRATRMVPLPQGAIANGVVYDEALVAEALRELIRPLRLGSNVRAVVGIPSALVATRQLSIPPCEDREIPSLVEGEMEHQGLSIEGGPLATIVFPKNANAPAGTMRSVTIILADVDVVRRVKSVVEAAGLKVAAVETSQVGKIRAATLAAPLSSATFFLVMGPYLTGVSYFSGSDLAANRRIEVGTSNLFRSSDGEAGNAASPPRIDHAAVDRLAIESLQMMEFVQRDYAEEIQNVRIYAIEPEAELLAPMLERRFGLPTTFSPPPPGLADVRDSIAYGLAVRSFKGPFNVPKIDLAAKLRKKNEDQESKRNLMGSLVASGFALAAGLTAFACYGHLIASVDLRAKKSSAQLAEIKTRIAAVENARADHSTLYRTLRHEGVPLGAVMDDVVGGIDSGVRLKAVAVAKNLAVQIKGEARDEAALGRMTQRLQASPTLKDVFLAQLDRMDRPGTAVLTFEIDATAVSADRVGSEVRS